MTAIRPATQADLPVIAQMGMKFIQYTEYRSVVAASAEDIEKSLMTVLEIGAIFVAEIDGAVRGFIAGLVHPAWFSPHTKIAMEMAWWMEEDYRKGTAGVRLVQAYESWAKQTGASFICMSDLIVNGEAPLSGLLPRMGYRLTERTHMKETWKC